MTRSPKAGPATSWAFSRTSRSSARPRALLRRRSGHRNPPRLARDRGWIAVRGRAERVGRRPGRDSLRTVPPPRGARRASRKPGPFQAVTMVDIIEHTPTPREAVAKAAALLEDGGSSAWSRPTSTASPPGWPESAGGICVPGIWPIFQRGAWSAPSGRRIRDRREEALRLDVQRPSTSPTRIFARGLQSRTIRFSPEANSDKIGPRRFVRDLRDESASS